MASGDTREQNYLDIAAHGRRADLPSETCCETRTQTLTREVAERIITEEETRAAADRVLQSEIDEIKNNPDVADIVPTYAALQDYDTSTLTDKDIIRVLADETHGGASTYYRWSTSTRTFTYVGESGDYYTKGQINALLDEKQDELTAGEGITIEDESGALVISATGGGGGTSNFNQLTNRPSYNGTTMTGGTDIPEVIHYTAGSNITISGNSISATDTTYTAGSGLALNGGQFSVDTNTIATKTDLEAKQDELTPGENITIEDESGGLVISATDTTYSDFTGTDGQTAGTAGLVPAPATTDAGKFLKADGTWGAAGGGNVGEAKVLTADDYNWNNNTGSATDPNCVALWKLAPGIYSGKDVPCVVIPYSSAGTIRPLIAIVGDTPTIGSTPFIYKTADNDWKMGSATDSLYSNNTILNSGQVVNNLNSTSTAYPLSAKQGKVLKDLIDGLVISNAGAPTTSTVGTVGQLYEDTTNGKLYICTDATNPYTWEEVGAGGGGPTVVQTTGTSTTDVMSQNAVTESLATKQDATTISNNTLYL